jgi:hypothetical protein
MEQRAVFIAPFWSRLPEHLKSDGTSYSSVQALRQGYWPFDFGDDPSFLASHKFGGPVSWGVCRRDVRRIAQPGDVVLFFSIQAEKPGVRFIYRFCGLLTVAQKIKQTEVWNLPKFTRFRRYDNLLIRPIKKHEGGWEHHEPGIPRKEWHSDWLPRLRFKNSQNEKMKRLGLSEVLSEADARQLVDENYVIFSRKRTESFICAEPRVVATCTANGRLEVWSLSSFASQLKMFTVTHARGSLRTTNKQRAHRHSTWKMDRMEFYVWKRKFIEWLGAAHCQEMSEAKGTEYVKSAGWAKRKIC